MIPIYVLTLNIKQGFLIEMFCVIHERLNNTLSNIRTLGYFHKYFIAIIVTP
jgi:hypothetical protein